MRVKKMPIVVVAVLFPICFYLFKIRGKGGSSLPNDTLFENIGSDVATLDPQQNGDNVSWRVILDLFEGLVGYDKNMHLVSTGAENWTVSEDGLVYTFNLRKNAKWSNGLPVTADDYVYSYRRSVTPSTLTKYYIEQFMSIRNAKDIRSGDKGPESLGVYAVDDYTLKIEMEHPNPEFLDYLTMTAFFPIPQGCVEKYGLAWTNDGNIVSNGPYELVQHISNGYIDLKKSEFYWDKSNVSIPKVRFLMINDVSADYQSFVAGEEDISYYKLPSKPISEYEKIFNSSGKRRFFVYSTLGQERIAFNFEREKFKDVRVRKAVYMLIDRQQLVDGVFRGASVSYSPVPENMCDKRFSDIYKKTDLSDFIECSQDERNRKAQSLLLECGYSKEKPLVFELAFPTGEIHKNMADLIQNMLNTNSNGLIECTLYFDEWKVFLQNMDDGKYEIFRSAWAADYNLSSSYTDLLVSHSSTNFGRYANGEIDNLSASSKVAQSIDKNLLLQDQIVILAMNDCAVIPMVCTPALRLVSNRVNGFPENNSINLSQSKWFNLEK